MRKVHFVNDCIAWPATQLSLLPLFAGIEPTRLDYTIDFAAGKASIRLRDAFGLRSDVDTRRITQVARRLSEAHDIELLADLEHRTVDIVLRYALTDGGMTRRDCSRPLLTSVLVLDGCINPIADECLNELLAQVERDVIIASTDLAPIRHCPPPVVRCSAA